MLLPLFILPISYLRDAAWDFYVMGNERAMIACIMELKRRDPQGTADWLNEMAAA